MNRRVPSCRDTLHCKAACKTNWLQGNYFGVCLCAGSLHHVDSLGILGRSPAWPGDNVAPHARLCLGDTLATTAAAHVQAFGSDVSQLVVLSIQPVTSWAVTTAEVML
jgi:hypothetical protein